MAHKEIGTRAALTPSKWKRKRKRYKSVYVYSKETYPFGYKNKNNYNNNNYTTLIILISKPHRSRLWSGSNKLKINNNNIYHTYIIY